MGAHGWEIQQGLWKQYVLLAGSNVYIESGRLSHGQLSKELEKTIIAKGKSNT